ncbi:MAG TPA: metalloregulator ArsR/SmtB family transcription factor [Candidatus Binatia bacterium]
MVSHFEKEGHFFGFAFFTADFLAPFFALLPPLANPFGVSLAQERPRRPVIGHVLLRGHARNGAADHVESQVLQLFEADATFPHVELLAALLVFAGEPALTNWSYFAKCGQMVPAMSPSSQPTLWRTCRVLANRKRLQILALLIRQPNQTVSAVADRMSLSMPAASQYLRALEARGLVTCRRMGRRVEYRAAAGTSEGAAGEIVKALHWVFRRRAQPIEAIFKLATGFTHPRRIEVFRAVTNGADSSAKLQAATKMPARALARHLAKLEARGFVENERKAFTVRNQTHPLGRVLARLAVR